MRNLNRAVGNELFYLPNLTALPPPRHREPDTFRLPRHTETDNLHVDIELCARRTIGDLINVNVENFRYVYFVYRAN